MQQLEDVGRIWYPNSKAKRPRLKRYLDEQPGPVIENVWTDISPINSRAAERLGYPMQKPLALLERIIAASSNPGDVGVLDGGREQEGHPDPANCPVVGALLGVGHVTRR